MRIIVNVKERRQDGGISIEAKLDAGGRDTLREGAAGEALFGQLKHFFHELDAAGRTPHAPVKRSFWRRMLAGGKK